MEQTQHFACSVACIVDEKEEIGPSHAFHGRLYSKSVEWDKNSSTFLW